MFKYSSLKKLRSFSILNYAIATSILFPLAMVKCEKLISFNVKFGPIGVWDVIKFPIRHCNRRSFRVGRKSNIFTIFYGVIGIRLSFFNASCKI